MEKRFKFRHVNEWTGIFVLGFFVVIGLGLFFTARAQQWFVAKVEYELQLPPEGAYGLGPGNEVVLLGLPAGVVSMVRVSEGGRLRARIRIRRDFSRFIGEDSLATIKKVFGVAGDSYVEISRGTRGPLPEKGAVIPCVSSEELPTMMDRVVTEVRNELLPMVRKLSDALEEWSRLGRELNGSQVELHQALTRLNRVARGLDEGKGTAGRLLQDPTLAERGENLLGEAQKTLADLQTVAARLQEGTVALPQIMENVHRATEPLPEISKLVEGEASELGGLVFQMRETASEVERLSRAAQRHWLLRNYVEPPSDSGRIPPEEIAVGSP